MSTTIRSLFALAILFAGMTGCAVDNDQEEAATEEKAEEDKSDETSETKVEASKLGIQKKGRIDTLGRPESPKK